jgi:hypothetical protein
MPLLHTFDQVAAHYASVRPVISIHHDRSDDIRPIGQRRYKWERIIKVDENTYALSDGQYDEAMNKRGYTPEFLLAQYPIVWIRKPDGDYVRIRNGSGTNAHMSRYTFLGTYLPKGMHFTIDNGLQYIGLNPYATTTGEVKEYRLPKSMYIWDWHSKKPTGEDDHMYLLFKVLQEGKYERAGTLLDVKTRLIDRDLKKKYKAQTDEFFGWFTTMYALLTHVGWNECQSFAEEINEHEGRQIFVNTWAPFRGEVDANFVRDLLAEPEHPLRTAFAIIMKNDIGQISTITTPDELRLLRSRYTRLMNKLLNVFKVEQV